VAADAGGRRMFACQGELCIVVIELRPQPLRRVVAEAAILREPRCRMIRIRRFLEVLQVASDAICAQSGELAAYMAAGAGGCRVFARQRELCSVVIENRSGPLNGCVASLTSLRKASGDVVWICRLLEVWQVAGNASRGQRRVLVVHMAGRASDGCVFAGQGEFGRVVVEDRPGPLDCRMASFAGLRET
jgi:hypothetical protein